MRLVVLLLCLLAGGCQTVEVNLNVQLPDHLPHKHKSCR